MSLKLLESHYNEGGGKAREVIPNDRSPSKANIPLLYLEATHSKVDVRNDLPSAPHIYLNICVYAYVFAYICSNALPFVAPPLLDSCL